MIRDNSADNILLRPIKRSNNNKAQLTKVNYYSNPIISPQDGIPFENVYNPDDSLLLNLECSICLNLIWKPIELNECGHTFCEYCINQSIEKSGNFCPLCKTKPITKRISKTLLRFLNQVKIKCPNNGCNITPEYSDYLSHLEKCSYRLYHCGNNECRYNDILSRMKLHVDKCKYRLVYCIYCSKNIKYYQKEGHDNIESKEIIECPKCKVQMTKFEYYKNHYNENNNNICCLKNQVKYWINKYNEINNKYKKKEKKINELKEFHKKEIEEAQNLINELMESHKKEVIQYKNNIKLLEQNENKINYNFVNNNNNNFIDNNNNQNSFNKNKYINLLFKENYSITSIQCHIDEVLSDVIEKYKAKNSDYNIENKKFYFNSQRLNLSLTVSEAGLMNNSPINVINYIY